MRLSSIGGHVLERACARIAQLRQHVKGKKRVEHFFLGGVILGD